MTIILDGPKSDLAEFQLSTSPPYARLSTFASASGAEIARMILDNIQLADINTWIAQGLLYAEVIKRLASNINSTIKDAEDIYAAIIRILNIWLKSKDKDFVIWEGEKIVFSSDMPIEKKERFIKALTIQK